MRDPVKIVHPSGRELTVSRSRAGAFASADWKIADETPPEKVKAAPVSSETARAYGEAINAAKTPVPLKS